MFQHQVIKNLVRLLNLQHNTQQHTFLQCSAAPADALTVKQKQCVMH